MSSRPPPLPPPTSPPSRRPGGSAAPPAASSSPDTDRTKPTTKIERPRSAATTTTDPGSKPTNAPRAARYATYALVAFTALTLVTLAAWFATADQPWGFSSFVTVLSALLGIGATALLWRQPTREHAIGGLAVMGLSLVRVGLPTNWTMVSVALITFTALLAIPVVQAVIVLPRS